MPLLALMTLLHEVAMKSLEPYSLEEDLVHK